MKDGPTEWYYRDGKLWGEKECWKKSRKVNMSYCEKYYPVSQP